MVWLETPTNPTMKLVDIEAVCKLVHDKSQAFVVVDNTFMSSYFQVHMNVFECMVLEFTFNNIVTIFIRCFFG